MNRRLIKKAALMVFMGIFLVTSTPTASAAISGDTKSQLDEIVAELGTGGSSQLTEIITYLYSAYLKKSYPAYTGIVPNSGSTGSSNTGTSPSTNNSTLCTYAKGLTKTLDISMTDPQVRTLQQLLNTLAAQDASYQSVTLSGEGSRGQETDFYGTATQRALTAWQTRNMTGVYYTPGVLDTATRSKLQEKYCASTATISTAGSSSNSNAGSSGSASESCHPITGCRQGSAGASSSTKRPAEFSSISGPGLGADGRVRWKVSYPTGTGASLGMRIGTGSASKCEDVSSHIVRDGKAYMPRTEDSSNTARIQKTFSYDEDTLGESTTYYYCFTLSSKSGTIYSEVSSFKVADLKYETKTVNPPTISVNDNSVRSGQMVTINYNTNGLSNCVLSGGGFSPSVSGEGSRTWTATQSTTFTLSCTGGWAKVAVSVDGAGSTATSDSGATTVTSEVNLAPASVTLTTSLAQKASQGFALVSGKSANMKSIKVNYAPSGVSGDTCVVTPSGTSGWWSCIFAENTNPGNTTTKAEITIYGTPNDGVGQRVYGPYKLTFE